MSVHSRWGAVACGGVVAALVLVGVGCGGADKPVPVRGTVTLDGAPVDGAVVLFIPSGTGREANGHTGADGSFQLTTRNTHDGALRGEYKVVVQYSEGIEAPSGGNVKDVMEGFEKAQKEKKAKKAPRYVIPPRYSDPAKTELRQAVPTDGPVTLALVSK